MANFKWTAAKKKAAAEELLGSANHYEVKPRKRLVGIKYLADGRARWIGQAHDYTVDMSVKRD